MILGYCKLGRVDEAKGLVGRAEDKDAVMYTILIDALCRRGEVDEVEKILEGSEFNGWKPNDVTYNVYINGLCKLGEVDRAFRQLDVMRENGFLPTLETLHILFASLCRDQSDERLWEAKALLDRSNELDWDVNAYFYCTLMSKFCDKGMNKPVVSLLTCMFKRGIEPDTCTYTVVLRSLCKKKYLRKAKCIFHSMGSEADIVAYNTLLLGFNRANEHNEVYILFMNMVEDKVSPNGFTFCVLMDSLCRENKYPEAVDCFIQSIRNGFNRNLISRPIWWLVKEGKVKELLNLFEEMFGRGFVLNDFVFDPLIRAFCRKGLCRSVQSDIFSLIFDKMLSTR
ncbi:pentatricopeptide repeat-containing protein At1g63400-like [Asparagus officinalis]|nr:pentatricopeptide repeat-containing protein At1g63400-like [Asparagus officinalis]